MKVQILQHLLYGVFLLSKAELVTSIEKPNRRVIIKSPASSNKMAMPMELALALQDWRIDNMTSRQLIALYMIANDENIFDQIKK